ncbi:MAG: cellulase family glycosylhydrolase [Cyclobacteriaceae bacterium]|nr:cellulase family glycosylhydrolase [Cyclobacteriaceae bacterium]
MIRYYLSHALLPLVFFISCEKSVSEKDSPGPLRNSTDHPGYFTDDSGKAIYLTGAHTWNNLVDMVADETDEVFDYPEYMTWMKQRNYNFFRLWAWELMNWDTRGNNETEARVLQVFPHPWKRTGPGNALDGKPKFDLGTYDEDYFERLKERVGMAGESGIYVAVMLFEGWGLQFSPNAFENHPFHPGNNINEVNGDTDGDGSGIEIHTLGNERVMAIQEAYVRKVIETVNESDFVLYEIANECHPSSTDWQYHMINLIRKLEKEMPKQHPVGMTFQYKGGSNQALFESPADWISPNPENGYRDDPPARHDSKAVITDTDHLWGIGGNSTWVWKSFLRGLNPIFMDPYDQRVLSGSYDPEWVEPLRKSLGYSRQIADSINLTYMVPDTVISSSAYCLADQGEAFLVFLPDTVTVSVDLEKIQGIFECSWFDPSNGEFSQAEVRDGGEILVMTTPFNTRDNVLYLKKLDHE